MVASIKGGTNKSFAQFEVSRGLLEEVVIGQTFIFEVVTFTITLGKSPEDATVFSAFAKQGLQYLKTLRGVSLTDKGLGKTDINFRIIRKIRKENFVKLDQPGKFLRFSQ